ncbi:hypothetical protein HPB50_017405 [Hyalomma asiaticum]|uniref:Uncharacterized protein n=1 Tax=Hyalomma asiaticum TaxID=266040 RepID=A0ACB7SZN6_HYAAI|nr:hypothetical protein HPB50_017405 [Hyalomma asiaticum]
MTTAPPQQDRGLVPAAWSGRSSHLPVIATLPEGHGRRTSQCILESTGYNRPLLFRFEDDLHQLLEVVGDDQESTEEESAFRENLADETAVNERLEAYSPYSILNISWVVWKFQRAGKRMVFHKTWRCQHHKDKKAGPCNAACMAWLDVKIKLVMVFYYIKTDKYLCRDVPLPAIIHIDARHSHSTQSADALQLLRGTRTRETFQHYFSKGITPEEARRLHESKLCMEDGPAKLTNGALNPSSQTVRDWHNVWREACFGSRDIDPPLKHEEKASFLQLKAPKTFVTDKSVAEKAALEHTWPSTRQLLCHFHVAQGEWRWLTTSKNNVDKEV